MKGYINIDSYDKMYDKLDLSKEQIKLLDSYFSAFSNLYNIITMEKAYSIIKSQNPDEFTEENFLAFVDVVRHDESKWYSILGDDELFEDGNAGKPMQRKLIGEWLLEDDEDLETMLFMQKGKPYYVPEKEEFLKYADDFYYEETPQTKAVFDFFVNEMGMDKKMADDMVCEAISTMCISLGEAEVPFDDFARMKIYFTKEQAEKFLKLFVDLYNNTRHPFNRGYTPCEMQKRVLPFADSILTDEEKAIVNGFAFAENLLDSLDNLPQKISRNAPCPCGSGKTYKRCCGKK
ncbi:MAG: SEC-C domain-containing protein [Ruminococcus sp.]|nr:SEC-C domain-containing protein [Ruminococcus sp.]